jgi:hypothetical protein
MLHNEPFKFVPAFGHHRARAAIKGPAIKGPDTFSDGNLGKLR